MRPVSPLNFYSLCIVLLFACVPAVLTAVDSKGSTVLASNQNSDDPLLFSPVKADEGPDNNELTVSAAVPRSFSFSLSESGENGSYQKLVVISTNSQNGWNAWAKPAGDKPGDNSTYNIDMAPLKPSGYPTVGTGEVQIVRPVLNFGGQDAGEFQKFVVSDGSNNGAAVVFGPAGSGDYSPVVLIAGNLF